MMRFLAVILVLALAACAPAQALSFAELVASVSQPPPAERLSAEEESRLAYSVSLEAFHARQKAVLEKAGGLLPDDKPNGKQSMRVDLARLALNPQDTTKPKPAPPP